MDPMTAIAIGKFVLDAIKEGVPVAEKAIELLRGHTDQTEAQALVAQLETEYAASRDKAAQAYQKLMTGGT